MPSVARRKPAGVCLALFALAAGGGCARTYETVTSTTFWHDPGVLFARPEPEAVLRDPNATGDQIVYALQDVEEPAARGAPHEQDEILGIVARAAAEDDRALCRLAAIEALGRFKDPRAVPALIRAYNSAEPTAPEAPGVVRLVKAAGDGTAASGSGQTALPSARFGAEMVTTIRCRSLEALGRHRDPAALPLLMEAVASREEAEAEGGDGGLKQASLGRAAIPVTPQSHRDVRMAAARALGEYRGDRRAAGPLVALLGERDTALRNASHQSLGRITGADLPPDPGRWRRVIESPEPLAPREEASVAR